MTTEHARKVEELEKKHEAKNNQQLEQISKLQKEVSYLRVQLIQKDTEITDTKALQVKTDDKLKKIQVQNKILLQDKDKLINDQLKLKGELNKKKSELARSQDLIAGMQKSQASIVKSRKNS